MVLKNCEGEGPSEMLERAAKVVELNGHCKSMFRDAAGRVCIKGAIRAAVRHDWFLIKPTDDEYRLVAHLEGIVERDSAVRYLADWNDADERTQEEVVAALRGAARSYAIAAGAR